MPSSITQMQGGVAQLLQAEAAAEEIVQQAQAEAEQILCQRENGPRRSARLLGQPGAKPRRRESEKQ